MHAHRCISLLQGDLPDTSKSLLHWPLCQGFALMKGRITVVTHTLSKAQLDNSRQRVSLTVGSNSPLITLMNSRGYIKLKITLLSDEHWCRNRLTGQNSAVAPCTSYYIQYFMHIWVPPVMGEELTWFVLKHLVMLPTYTLYWHFISHLFCMISSSSHAP